MPKNIAVAARYATLIPGAADVVAELRREGVKIGSTTGYTREIMAEILPVAARQGFAPDSLVCTGDTPDGRPTPFMLYKTLLDLEVWPAWSVIKVDDTEVGIAEGINAGRMDGRRVGQRQLFRTVARGHGGACSRRTSRSGAPRR